MSLTDLVRVFDVSIAEVDSPDYPLLALDLDPHKLSVSFTVPHAPNTNDDESLAVDFNLMCDKLREHSLRKEKFQGTEELADELCRNALSCFDAVTEIIVTAEKERYGERSPRKLGVSAQRTRDGLSGQDIVFIKGMHFEAMVGIHEWERMVRGVVTADISLVYEPWKPGGGVDLPGLVASIHDGVSKSDDLTLESLAASLAETALSFGRDSQHLPKQATVKLSKPKAVPSAQLVEVEVTRTPEYFVALKERFRPAIAVSKRPTHKGKSKSTSSSITKAPSKHTVAIAIGSNVGDRYSNIEKALRQIESRHEIITITDTSFMYESEPMYVQDQSKFLNCIIMVETVLRPADLLTLLKHIEDLVGRVKTLRNGPRSIDLDIVFYDSLVLDTRTNEGDGSGEGELVIPHARVCEREFVLRPLNDVIPEYIHPVLKATVRALLNIHTSSHPATLHKVLTFPSPPRHQRISSTLWPLSRKTYLMATINATPDSFSSSGPSTTASAIASAIAAAADGADIIDVGGYSTRPGASTVSPEEELKRVVPVVRKIRDQGIALPISVDTFRPAVLRAAVEAGANCLNDVTALAGEGGGSSNEMTMTARDLGIPVVMMHSRGAHNAGENKEYGERGVVAGVRQELGESVAHALRCGLRRWNIVVDPGFGFSKTTEGNVELLSRFRELTASRPEIKDRNPLDGFPTLAGLSRKSFLGNVLGRDTQPQERSWATGAAVTAAVQQGADVVRVHSVAEMRDVLKIADAVWRTGGR